MASTALRKFFGTLAKLWEKNRIIVGDINIPSISEADKILIPEP